MANVLAISNQKGGVGKTTTAINLASALAALGRRTLLVDIDPQGNASSGVGHPKDTHAMGIADVLLGFRDLRDVLVPTAHEGLLLAPATEHLVGVEVELIHDDRREFRLKNALATVQGDVDFVLIDCPPSLNLLTVNALTAAHGVLIPLQAEYYAMEGLGQLVRTITAVKKGLNPRLRRAGVVMTMTDPRTNLSRDVVRQAREVFGAEVFATEIPRNVRLAEAPSHGLPIGAYDPSCRGAEAYAALAHEVAARCDEHAPSLLSSADSASADGPAALPARKAHAS